ncbi:cytochrome P450 [Kitasatospora sp. MAP12-15]|uniref:cytochrome P450 family protein n=1 Tax=unclassified Kitasatospora TaxID=2633591 RepID=UPI002474BACA|nr:cytochrome P450 [Kitasatospora sp. MAP12-44]MDH6108810.1 cytochrome P450 [Kitasatospora sp. MAP12-44]
MPDGSTAAHQPVLIGSPSFKADAHAEYARLREAGPIHRVRMPSGLSGWLVVSHDLAREAFTHPLLGKDPEPAQAHLDAVGYTRNRTGVGLGGNMLTADPPHHTRLRKLVAGAFSARRMAALGPRIQQITDELLDGIAPLGSTDLVESFTGPLPMTVISELLGVPEEHRDQFRHWSQQALGNPPEKQREGATNLNRYLAELLADKRRNPGEDLLSALVAVHDEVDGRLSEEELLGTAVLLVVAGHDTTANLLANAALRLLREPEQAELLRRDPALLAGAVEEFLRHDAPVDTTPLRFASGDLTLGGADIRTGDVVVISLTSVGHDVEGGTGQQPLDVTRPAARHLSFGHGIHHCIGAPLARLEGVIALGTLLRRLPDLALTDPEGEVAWIPAGIIHGPLLLPVRFTPQPTQKPTRDESALSAEGSSLAMPLTMPHAAPHATPYATPLMDRQPS